MRIINTIFTITDADLSLYKSEKSYNPGKVDPFAEAADTSTEGEGTTPSAPNGETQTQVVDPNTSNNYYTAAGIGSGTK